MKKSWLAVAVLVSGPFAVETPTWSSYGGDPGGSRFAPLVEITPNNVSQLEIAWSTHTGDVSDGTKYPSTSRFEATPILRFGLLFVSTPFDRVLALDPRSGRIEWAFDPHIDLTTRYSEGLVSRGVAAWEDRTTGGNVCRRRIFIGTVDARLFAIDAMTGSACRSFGTDGQVDLKFDVGTVERGEYGVTSPPVVIGDRVVVGSSSGDNRGVDLEKGTVHAFDARTGGVAWTFDPIPRKAGDPAWDSWEPKAALRTRQANAWGPLSIDLDRDLVFVPTGSAAPDYFGGLRPGRDMYANSIIALKGSTGSFVWAFQIVHHDLWDYDIPAQPVLVDLFLSGRTVPAVVVSTKMGHVFVFDRTSGSPVFAVEERPVPGSTVPGESAWPTQPFPALPPLTDQHALTPDEAWGLTLTDRQECQGMIRRMRAEGLFTPPSLEGTILFPGTVGGMSWGGVAIDQGRGILYATVNRWPMWVRLIPRAEFGMAVREGRGLRAQFTAQRDTPFGMSRGDLVASSGSPCIAPPWGKLVALDLQKGAIKWDVPIGSVPGFATQLGTESYGSNVLGGPFATASGLVFAAGTEDNFLRAFNAETGKELWKGALPAGGQATPMTYGLDRQYVVVAAGGHGGFGTTLGDSIVAFALPRHGADASRYSVQPQPSLRRTP
jgi:quinoprotein glucose dehydrogenase